MVSALCSFFDESMESIVHEKSREVIASEAVLSAGHL
jgi:hypothetical protein